MTTFLNALFALLSYPPLATWSYVKTLKKRMQYLFGSDNQVFIKVFCSISNAFSIEMQRIL